MDVKNFRFKDKDGNILYEFPITGVAPDITVSASVDNNIGTPSVTVTKSGENDAPTYQLDFKNLKGVQGPPVTLDTSVSTTSHNGVENQAITNYVNILNRNIISRSPSLMSYTANKPYFTPTDGYMVIINTSSIKGYGVIQSSNDWTTQNVGVLTEGYFTLFLKKGMRIYPLDTVPPAGLYFYSLIS